MYNPSGHFTSATCIAFLSSNKCGKAMASNGNINKGIQLITDVIDYKMLQGKYPVGMLSAHPMRLHK